MELPDHGAVALAAVEPRLLLVNVHVPTAQGQVDAKERTTAMAAGGHPRAATCAWRELKGYCGALRMHCSVFLVRGRTHRELGVETARQLAH